MTALRWVQTPFGICPHDGTEMGADPFGIVPITFYV
jgi:hypothetical protein